MLVKSPGFTIVAVLTLALGIGANTAIFSIVNAVLCVRWPTRIRLRWSIFGGNSRKTAFRRIGSPSPNTRDLLDHNESFSQIAAYSLGGRANLTRADAQPVQVSTGNATAGVLPLLGIAPVLGRTFGADEDLPGHSHYALLSYALWQSQFGGDANIVTKPIQLDGETYSVVGVLPKQFSLAASRTFGSRLGLIAQDRAIAAPIICTSSRI